MGVHGGGENPEMPNEARGEGKVAGKDGTKRWKRGRRWKGVSPFCR